MKTIGMIGGMSWESTLDYYRYLNEGVKQKLGGLHSAQCLLFSVDFAEIEEHQRTAHWDLATDAMVSAALRLERGGADFIIICTNTMHKMASEVQAAVQIPVLHIVDALAVAIKAAGINTIGLLGTRFTMEQDFYKGRLEKLHNIKVLVPDPAERQQVHDIIYHELCLGNVRESSRQQYQQIIASLQDQGAQGIILGCTEIGMLVKQKDSSLPLFDSTLIHAQMAVSYALGEMANGSLQIDKKKGE